MSSVKQEHRLRRNGALALAVLCGVFGFWLGEGSSPLRAALPLVGGATGSLAVTLVVPGRSKSKALAGVASLALYAAAFFVGLQSFSHAFNECIKEGEEVRVRLSDYYKKENKYPESLNKMQGHRLCERVLRPSILEYERTNGGYILSFRDWLVEHTATQSESFMAQK